MKDPVVYSLPLTDMMAALTLTLLLTSLGLVSPNIESWQQHLDQGHHHDPGVLGPDISGWGLSDHNLTECLGSCLCNGALADCSHRGLESVPLVNERNLVIHTL